VAPQKLEALLKNDPFVSEVLIYGDQKKYIVALIQIKNSSPDFGNEKILDEKIRAHVARVNQQLAGFESIKKFALTFDTWTVEGGELTPSLKLKRKMLTERYKTILDELY
jgi:long-chain acyl-CoA synthetase